MCGRADDAIILGPGALFTRLRKILCLPQSPMAICLGAMEPKLVEVDKYVDNNHQEE